MTVDITVLQDLPETEPIDRAEGNRPGVRFTTNACPYAFTCSITIL
jgi:hypothetical protein